METFTGDIPKIQFPQTITTSFPSREKFFLSKRFLLAIISAESFLIAIFFLVVGFFGSQIVPAQTQKSLPQVLSIDAQAANHTFPARLQIPSINVDAAVQYLGLTKTGAMDVPSNTADVGWYELGPSPGDQGSAVISGHFDGRDGKSGVFNNLDRLKPGDKMYIISDLGTTITYMVRESRTYNPGYADEVFFPGDSGRHLNLVTCDGTWDKDKKSYSKRLVVFSDII